MTKKITIYHVFKNDVECGIFSGTVKTKKLVLTTRNKKEAEERANNAFCFDSPWHTIEKQRI